MPKKLKKKTGKAADGYGDYRKVLERDDIDAVGIVTPDHWHALQCIQACEAGFDVKEKLSSIYEIKNIPDQFLV